MLKKNKMIILKKDSVRKHNKKTQTTNFNEFNVETNVIQNQSPRYHLSYTAYYKICINYYLSNFWRVEIYETNYLSLTRVFS